MKLKMAKSKQKSLDSSSEKVAQILQGAMQEFLANGYSATSMDRIAATAGVSKATVYSHFGDKEGLFAALVEKLAKERFSLLLDPQPLQGEPDVLFRYLASNLLRQIIDDREYLNFVRLIIGESGRFPQLARIFLKNITKPSNDKLIEYLRLHPELKIKDIEATTRVIMGAIIHLVLVQEILHGKEIMPLESDRLINCLSDFILSSAKANKASHILR